jgi:endoglucanase
MIKTSLHQYLDADASGTLPTCVRETIGIERKQRVTGWLRERGAKGLLAEVRVPGNALGWKALDQQLASRRQLGDGTVTLAKPAP